MNLKLKKPQIKNDAFLELRQWMYQVWLILNGIANIRGDGNRILVTQSMTGTVIRLVEDDYKKKFPFFVESRSGGAYSKNKLFTIRGGEINFPKVSFELSPETKMTIDKKYFYLTIKNLKASEAAEIPDGDGETQQDIDIEQEDKLFGYFKLEDDKIAKPIKKDEINILIGTQLNGVFTQKHVGDITIAGLGSNEYIQITDVDYTKDNKTEVIYRGIKVDSPNEPLLTEIDEDDKQGIYILEGYPWNLVAGDNIPVIEDSGNVLARNSIAPEPVIKIEGGVVKVFDKEDEGSFLTNVQPDYRVMTAPTNLDISKYDDTFIVAQWSKRDELVRIYIPVI